MQREKLALLIDFDETAAEQNVAELLLQHFGPLNWTELRQAFREGRLTLQEYQETAFRHVRASPQEMGRFAAAQATLRPGLVELARYCETRAIPLVIATYGLDFYVQAVLKRHGLFEATRVSAVATRPTPEGLDFFYPDAAATCQGWGNCKCRILERTRSDGDRIIYVGDGRSDFCPAAKAHLVFARGPLLEHCRQQGIPYREFPDFHPVLAALQDGLLKSG